VVRFFFFGGGGGGSIFLVLQVFSFVFFFFCFLSVLVSFLTFCILPECLGVPNTFNACLSKKKKKFL
jgi:hypothetical protein